MNGSLLQQLSLTFELFPLFYSSFGTYNYYFFTPLLSSLSLGSMETRLTSLVLVSILLFTTFSTVSRESVLSPIVYSRDQLLALSSAAVPPHEQPDVPRELRRRRRRGCHSRAVRRSKRTRYRPVLPSVITGNVRSLPNKIDELTALTRHQRDYHECSIMVLTETWLTELTLDTDANLDGF